MARKQLFSGPFAGDTWPIHTASEVLEQVARHHGMVHDDGRVNYSALADRMGVAQASVSRAHRGILPGSKTTPEQARKVWKLSTSLLQALMDGFGLTYRQAAGLEPLPWEPVPGDGREGDEQGAPERPAALFRRAVDGKGRLKGNQQALRALEDSFTTREVLLLQRFRALPLAAQDEILTMTKLKCELEGVRRF